MVLEDKRTETMTTKVSPKEKANIHDNAISCNMNPSEFLRHVGQGYKPTAAVTAEEKKLLMNLEGCRTDTLNFANAISMMSQEDKFRMFKDVPSMLRWYKKIYPISVAIEEFVVSVLNGGRITPRTRKTLKKLLKDDSKG